MTLIHHPYVPARSLKKLNPVKDRAALDGSGLFRLEGNLLIIAESNDQEARKNERECDKCFS